MDFIRVITLFSFLFSVVVAFPQQTAAGTTTAIPATITKAASLSCSDGQTAVYTTDCTMGTPTSYCARPEPPSSARRGTSPRFGTQVIAWSSRPVSLLMRPGSRLSAHMGQFLGQPRLSVSCSCTRDQWYSMTILPGASTVDTFCMPSSSCPAGMTTSVSTNTYCATAPASVCSDIPLETNYCKCESAAQTPVYPDSVGAAPTGCRS
ncbi:hypothetical protein N7516_009482 [Penicillium verrucosum]|uniref:uncharacterized protein n=1 Tax=Penicillium verrucosum TaxID=60171 RepID=UPI0025459BAC|nr:uncharacterized protein N7516_009482 [Penicillium verrucosum]KAJ5921779.1 hypothetical protein N7516_009482 [Penicillium verrucosum]